jgi:hypothetical protein
MRAAWFGLLSLAACGGDDETDGDCEETSVVITVVDEASAPVEGADVELEAVPCPEGEPGVYTCLVPSDAEYRLYVVKTPEHNPHGETIVIEPGACEFPVAVTLPPALVY